MIAALACGCSRLPVVDVETVQSRDLAATVAVDCVARAARFIRITAGVSGRVDAVTVVSGQRVDVGGVLVRLGEVRAEADGRASAAAVAEARATLERGRLDVEAARVNLDLARRVAARQAALWRDRVVSRADYWAAVAEAELARGVVLAREAAVAAAESLLRTVEVDARRARAARREHVVRAPFAGVVSRVHVAEGLHVQAPQGRYRGSALLDLDGGDLLLAADVLAADVPMLRPGQPVAVRVHAYPGRPFTARVEAVRLESSEFGVRVDMLPLGDWSGVRSGFSCEAEVTTVARRAVVAVSRRALVSWDDQLGVWRIEDGRVSFTALSAGVQGDIFVEVLSGLAAGDSVVVGPFDVAGSLEPGQRIETRALAGSGVAVGLRCLRSSGCSRGPWASRGVGWVSMNVCSASKGGRGVAA